MNLWKYNHKMKKPFRIYQSKWMCRRRIINFSHDSRLIVCDDGVNINIYNIQLSQLTPKYILKGHTNDIISVSFSNDNKRVLSGSDDRTIRIWDIEKQKEIKIIKTGLCVFV